MRMPSTTIQFFFLSTFSSLSPVFIQSPCMHCKQHEDKGVMIIKKVGSSTALLAAMLCIRLANSAGRSLFGWRSIFVSGFASTTVSSFRPSPKGGAQSVSSIPPQQTRFLKSQAGSIAEPEVKVPKNFVPHPFEYHEVIQLRIEKLTNRGLGLARVTLSDDQSSRLAEYNNKGTSGIEAMPLDEQASESQWVVFVPSVIPGEVVKARIFRNLKNYSEADLLEVMEASEHRQIPKCHLAGECGGCQLQHMSIEAQREMKTHHVKGGLAQFDIKNVEVMPCMGTNEIYEYRSKLTPHYNHPSKSRRGVKNVESGSPEKMIEAIGFQKQSSRQLVDVDSCLIATPEVNRAYQKSRETLLSEPPKGKKGATLLFRQANIGDEHVETNHKMFITTTVDGLNFTYRAGNFFQNNNYVLPLMVESVVKEATSGGEMTHLADCYCGSGLFALSSSKYFERVVGIEINDMAIAEATANAQQNKIENCEFLAASAENIFSVISDFPRDTSVVVLDPPRKGCSEDFLSQLKEFAPKRVVYMSCDPTTQARDATFIVDSGYEITLVQPFDLFPQTRHIECLMIFERK